MPTYPPRLIFNAYSYMKRSWTFPNQTEQVAWYSQTPAPTPSVTLWHQIPGSGSQGACCSLCTVSPWEQGPWLTASTVPGTHRKSWLVLASWSPGSAWNALPPALYLAYSYIILQDSAKLHLLQEVTAGYAGMAVPARWPVAPHPPFSQHLPHFAVVACLTVCQAYLILRFHEVLDQEW